MKLKEATPATGAATEQTPKNNTHCKLGSYEKRCLERLIRGCCERSKLDRYIGTSNSPEYIRQLRRKGLTITTNRVKVFNRDGRPVLRGSYCIHSGSMALALKMLGGK